MATDFVLVPASNGPVFIPSSVWASLKEPVIIVPPLNLPATIRINGATLLTRGNSEGPTTTRTLWTSMLAIPPEWLPPRAAIWPVVEISLGLPGGPGTTTETIILSDRSSASFSVFLRNLLNRDMVTAFSFMSLFIGLASLVLWMRNGMKGSEVWLYFSLFNVGLAFSQAPMILAWDNAPSRFAEQVRVIAGCISMQSAGAFVLALTRLYRRPWHWLIISLPVFLPLWVWTLAASDSTVFFSRSIASVSTASNLFGLGQFAFALIALKRDPSRINRNLVFIMALAAFTIPFDWGTTIATGHLPWVRATPYITFLSSVFFIWIQFQAETDAKRLAEQKSAELDRLNASLEATVQERTRELLEINNVKDRFFAVLSHDLRNQLHGAEMLASLLARKATLDGHPDSGLDMLALATSGDYILLDDILVWAKAGLSVIAPKPEMVALKDLASVVVSSYRPHALLAGVRVDIEMDRSLVANTDRRMTELLFRNLLVNALDATPKGGSITISGRSEGGMLLVEMADTGSGFVVDGPIPIEGARRGGEGIGLMLCRDFARIMGMGFAVAARTGGGTVFSLSFRQDSPASS
ncbi:MAG: HAMP domain-containing sensor histidine kinase [Spirochaetota bacterium]